MQNFLNVSLSILNPIVELVDSFGEMPVDLCVDFGL